MRQRKSEQAQYASEEAALASFFDEFLRSMQREAAKEHLDDAWQHAGMSFHVFENLIHVLAQTKTPINPRLRRAIDGVLEACEIAREERPELADLCYDEYWRKQYGYE